MLRRYSGETAKTAKKQTRTGEAARAGGFGDGSMDLHISVALVKFIRVNESSPV